MSESPAIDLERHAYGSPDAPMTIVEYGDFECPYCGIAAPVLRELVDTSGGRVRLVFRHFPLFNHHPFALTAALAAEASGDRFWEMSELLFANQTSLTDADLRGYGSRLGLMDVSGDAVQVFQAEVEADYASGVERGIAGTPTLCIDGQVYTGRVELRALRSALGL